MNNPPLSSIRPSGSPRLSRPKCPICQREPAKSLPAPAPWELAWCSGCHLGYMTNPPDCEAMTNEFEWEQSYYAEKKRRYAAHGPLGAKIATAVADLRLRYKRLTKRNKLHQIVAESGVSGEIIDIGCGNGHLWPNLPKNCIPIGIELSPTLAQQARARLGEGPGKLIEADALQGLRQLPDGSVNGAIAISFLEHEVRPAEMLRELRRALRRGGAFILKVPNYACWNRVIRGSRWCGYRHPDHVNYFTPRALRRILSRNGFQVARFRWSDRLPTSDNMWCVARTLCAPVASAFYQMEAWFVTAI